MLQTTMQLNDVINYLKSSGYDSLARLIIDYKAYYGVAKIYKNDLHNIFVGWFGAAQAEQEMKELSCNVTASIPSMEA